MFKNDLAVVLGRAGLKPAEVEVYLTCLQCSTGLKVQEIANETGIKRSTVNLILERLLANSFITYHLEGSRRVFTAEPPERLLFDMETLTEEFRSVLPLLKMTEESGQPARARFFEGKEGIAKIYNDQLLTLRMDHSAHKELLAISSGKNVFKILPDHQKQFIDRRIKERIPVRWIAPESEEDRQFLNKREQAYRQLRFFDSKRYPFAIEISVYSNKVALINLEEKQPSGVILEDRSLAQSMKSLFNLLWDSTKEQEIA